MDSLETFDFTKAVKLAKDFDQRLAEVRNIVSQPSDMFGGSKAKESLNKMKTEATDLLTEIRKMKNGIMEEVAAGKEKCNSVQQFINDLGTELDRIENIGVVNGFEPLDGAVAEIEDTQNEYKENNETAVNRRLF